MTAIHPGRQPATVTDGTLHPVTVQQLAELLADYERRVEQAYRDGYEHGHRSGWDVGYAHAHEEIAAAWVALAARIRGYGHSLTYAELQRRRGVPGGAVYEQAVARRGQTRETA